MSDALLAEQFSDLQQQRAASRFGIWIFLSTEMLFFGGPLFLYAAARAFHYDAFAAASRMTELGLGTANTLVLLTSSATMAVAVQAAESARPRRARIALFLTALLGAAFLVIKAVEYHGEFARGLFPGQGLLPRDATALFWGLYFAITGLHAVHLTIGIVLVSWASFRARRSVVVATVGLYWHFVDLVWIFLYPLLYLVGRS